MHKLQLHSDDAIHAAVASELRGSRKARFIHRMHAILLVSLGNSCYEVAAWLGHDPRTIERWVHAYEHDGVAGLHDHRIAGRPARLGSQQLRDLELVLNAGPGTPGTRWSGKSLARHLDRSYHIELSPRQCQRLLGRIKAAAVVPLSVSAPRRSRVP